MRITIVGTGYVGLVTGAGFAEFGHHVTCVDVDAKRIEMLKRNEMPFHEPGLPELVRRNAMHGRLTFVTNLREAVTGSLAVHLPANREHSFSSPALRGPASGRVRFFRKDEDDAVDRDRVSARQGGGVSP